MKIIEKAISIIIIAAVSLSCLSACKNNPSIYDNGEMRDKMKSTDYAKEMGLGINLGNTLESNGSWINGKTVYDYERAWGAVETTWEIIDGMKKAGFDTVRVPVYWGITMEDDGEFKISEELFNRVEEVINYCRKSKLYAVINIHHYDEYLVTKYEKDEVLRITDKLWTQIAQRYEKYSDYLIFEGFNENLGTVRKNDEYTDDEKFTYANQMNQTFVDAVRATGGNNKNRLLIISGYNTNIDRTTDDKFIVPTDTADDRIMVSVHYIDNSMNWSKNIGNDKWIEYSKSQCELLKKAFTDKGIPVFVGETTSIYNQENIAADAKYTTSSECLDIILEMSLDYGFVPVLWDVNDNFYSRTEFKIKSDSDEAVIKKYAVK